MAKKVLIEELHLSFFAVRGRPEREVLEGRRVLVSASFRRKLRALLTAAFRRTPALRHLSFEVSF
jgi:hypothetical protein